MKYYPEYRDYFINHEIMVMSGHFLSCHDIAMSRDVIVVSCNVRMAKLASRGHALHMGSIPVWLPVGTLIQVQNYSSSRKQRCLTRVACV